MGFTFKLANIHNHHIIIKEKLLIKIDVRSFPVFDCQFQSGISTSMDVLRIVFNVSIINTLVISTNYMFLSGLN